MPREARLGDCEVEWAKLDEAAALKRYRLLRCCGTLDWHEVREHESSY